MKRIKINKLPLAIALCALALSGGVELHARTKEVLLNASALLKKANVAYSDSKYAVATDYYKTYLQSTQGSKQDTVVAKLADCYLQMREYDSALREYRKISNIKSVATTNQQKIRIAELFARKGKYQQAADILINVESYRAKAQAYGQPETLEAMKKDSLNWNLSFLNLNTPNREFSPCLVGNTLLFSSNKALPTKKDAFGWDGKNYASLWEIPVSSISAVSINQVNDTLLAVAQKSPLKKKHLSEIYELGDTKQANKALGLSINRPTMPADSNAIGTIVSGLDEIKLNVGSIAVDKNNHIYFSSNYPKAGKNGINRICLMEGQYTSTGITHIKQLPFGDPNSYSVMHPAVNAEGTFLVCSSDMPNGRGGYDLYYAQRSDNSKPWGRLNPLSKNINTPGNEVFPTITPNGYLYFSSDAMPGLGGLDIYRVPLQDLMNGKATPEHLSYPINSTSDDFGWAQDDTGVNGYFTSDRVNSNDNLYSFHFEIPKIKRKDIEGIVLNQQSEPIEATTVFMLNTADNKVRVAKTDKDGKFRFTITNPEKVVIKEIKNEDCMRMAATMDAQDPVVIKKQASKLEKYKVGYTWKLDNIRYDYNKFTIRNDAKPILDSLAKILNTYPINVELGAHTDSRGKSQYNTALSQHRADAAVAYLIQHGIDSRRITAKGYGKSQLLNKCSDGVPCTEAEHQENRRTEVKVMSYNTLMIKKSAELYPGLDSGKFKDGEVIDISQLPAGFFDKCK